jgi:hypothetical protein
MIDITKSKMRSLKDMMHSIKNTKFVYMFIKIRVFLEISQIFPQILGISRNRIKIRFDSDSDSDSDSGTKKNRFDSDSSSQESESESKQHWV